MTIYQNYKNRLFVGAATSVVALCLNGAGTSRVNAQSAQPNVLPPVAIDAPQQRARPAATVRTRTAPQRATRVARRQPVEQQPMIPISTVGSTRTIGAPAPAYAGGQVATGGTLGLLGSQSAMNVPFSTVNYTSQLIENQQARTAADTLINDASVRVTQGANGFDDTFQIRGFQVGPGDVGLNGLYGLAAPNHVPAQITERIELLKGPGAFVNGMPPGGSVGGSINIVTKRATDVPFARITPFFMSAGNYGVHLEASRRYGDNNEWGVRFNGVGRNGEASIDGGNWRSGLAALSLDYRGDRLRWTFDAISQNDDTKNSRPQMTIQTTVPFIPAPPDSRSTWYPNINLVQRDNTIASGLEYDVTDWLTAYAGVGYRDGNGAQNLADSRVAGVSSGLDQFGRFAAYNAYYDFYSKAVSGNVGLRSRFNTGPISHAVNVAYTGFNQESGYGYVTSLQNPTPAYVLSNIYNPSPLPTIAAGRPPQGRSSDITLSSVAVSDRLSVLNERVLLTIGARHQMVRQDSYNYLTGAQTGTYDAAATTPLAGLVVKPLENVSLYVNYAEGLSQGTVVPIGQGFVNQGEVLAPYKSKQQEAGVKVDWGTITTTAAVFQIMRPNLVTTPAFVRAYDGEQRNRGLELNAYGLLAPGLRGMVSAMFLRPEITKSSTASEIGKDAAGVPDKTFSAGLDWDAPWVSGLAFNGRVIYTSGAYLTSANLLRYDDWTRVDIGARYTTTALTGKPVTFRANIENVGGANYWLSTGTFVTVGSPRTYILSAAFDF
ncbi:TonB-dependent receptor [Rhodopseudomonas boonkerdii]|uniref:TonB-dependent receptor n=1 Tax=Rhodopseudomonas boonkerdii TaxID=475937 RepID=UPI001E53082B|nr:TonB-dependent receptor [Rhodopseudomonas boonkerdii]UGV26776.1 TonB-dependent receptor [Rhodopseudomonas boonkerdii]